MARFRGGKGRAIVLAALLFLGFPCALVEAADDIYYDRPVLTVDPGMHTGVLWATSADMAGRFAVTGSDDKTVRVWSLSDGKLVGTIRVPAGSGAVGRIYAVAMSPDGSIVAAGGWTGASGSGNHPIYLFDRNTGSMIAHIPGLESTVARLVFSLDNRYLAATLGGENGVRVFDRDRNWSEIFRDIE